MSWNYRILAHEDGDEFYYKIHEVYYDESGGPDGYTTNSVDVSSDSLEGIRWVLDKMILACDKPILSVKNFPEEHSPEQT